MSKAKETKSLELKRETGESESTGVQTLQIKKLVDSIDFILSLASHQAFVLNGLKQRNLNREAEWLAKFFEVMGCELSPDALKVVSKLTGKDSRRSTQFRELRELLDACVRDERISLFLGFSGPVFAEVQTGSGIQFWEIESRQFSDWLARLHLEHFGDQPDYLWPDAETVKHVVSVFSAIGREGRLRHLPSDRGQLVATILKYYMTGGGKTVWAQVSPEVFFEELNLFVETRDFLPRDKRRRDEVWAKSWRVVPHRLKEAADSGALEEQGILFYPWTNTDHHVYYNFYLGPEGEEEYLKFKAMKSESVTSEPDESPETPAAAKLEKPKRRLQIEAAKGDSRE